ncbi:MAG: hypothetical protein HY821_24930 [Acidobacteria bacterium]|nr:hypothetical protein [Acidobacteriota bacterium]
MADYIENTENSNSKGNTGGLVSMLLVGGALVAALGGWWYQSTQVTMVRQELAQTQQKMDQMQSQMATSISAARSDVSAAVANMNEQVDLVRKDAVAGARNAQVTAKRQAGAVLNTLSAKNKELTEQIDQMKTENAQKSVEVAETLNGIKGEVGTVKTEVSATRSELSATAADLKRAFGDMGVMSGLIATNSTELAALKKLGERDYFEFTLPKSGGPQRVGDIRLTLKKADVKRNRFTLDVLADDKRVEKKDRTINEPVQFYTSAARTPYEVVINEVRKDQVIGYLAVPKVKAMAKR